jgi:hypothetical protein
MPSTSHFGVDPDRLDSMAGKLGQTSHKLTGLSSSLDRMNFGPQSYGLVGQGFTGPASQHVRQAKQLTDKVSVNVSHAETGTKNVAQNYRNTDDNAGKLVTAAGDGNHASGGTTHAPQPVASTSKSGGGGYSYASGSGSGGAGSSGGGRPPRKPGGNQPPNGHYDDKPDPKGKRKRTDEDDAAEQQPPPRRSRRNADQEPEFAMQDNAGMPARPGGGGFVLGNGAYHYADLDGPHGPVRVYGPHGPLPHDPNRPTGSENVNYGQVNVHHEGVNPQQFNPQPPRPGALPPNFGPPRDFTQGASTSHVTQDVMGEFAGRRHEFPSQNQVMGGSANHAMQHGGMHTDPDTGRDWMHLQGYSSGGEDHRNPNVSDNLITGEHGANMRHNQFENSIRNQGTSMMGAVPVTAVPTNPVNPATHTYGGLDFTTHSPLDPNRANTTHIDTTDPQMPRRADQDYVGRQEEVNQSWNIMGDLRDQGHNLNDYHPGMQGDMAAWDQKHYNPFYDKNKYMDDPGDDDLPG